MTVVDDDPETETETTNACPNCNSGSLRVRSNDPLNNPTGRPVDDCPTWRCRDCGHTFEQPRERRKMQRSWSPETILEQAGFGDLVDEGGGDGGGG